MNQYNHKLINDLAWAIGSNCLLQKTQYQDSRLLSDKWYKEQVKDNLQLLHEQDKKPQEIQSYLSSMPAFRLGHYFENLIAYWFQINPQFEIVSKNLIIYDDKVTLGEIDLIIKDLDTNKTIHLEVAVKFYLQVIYNNKPYWFGTNLNDRLDIKFNHLFNKQIELSKRKPAKIALKDHGIKVDEHWAILKGRLFSPYNSLDSDHYWTTITSFKQSSNANSKWVILEKQYWLSSIDKLNDNFLSKDIHTNIEIYEIFMLQDTQQPICVAECVNDCEVQRFFITSEDWSSKAIESLYS